MANIPGIVGYVGPGAFSLVNVTPGPVSLPGGPSVIAILGRGQREEAVVVRAVGGGKDGLPVGFNPANSPDGRHFKVSTVPVINGTIEVFISPVGDGTDLPLIRITNQAMASSWTAEFGDTVALSDPLALSLGISTITSSGPPSGTPAFGTARSYAILGGSAVTGSTGAGSTLTGNLGVSPGTSITNFPPSTATGTTNANNAAAAAAQASALASYTDLSTRPAGTTVTTLDGMTLTPGTYTASSTLSLASSGAGTVTFNGAGVYVIQVGSALTTGAGGIPTMLLTNGAKASDIYWSIGSSATINSGFAGTFQGNVIAQASITVTLGGTVNGTLAALTGAVTLSNTTAVKTQSVTITTTTTTDALDGYQALSSGSGFFNTKWGRQFQQLKNRLNITAGTPEPNHYIFDETTGRLVLDQPLAPFSTLIVSYLGVNDINDPELFFNIQDVVTKHGFPSVHNTISLAAQLAFENGAGVIMPVHAGQTLTGLGSAQHLIADPTLFDALKALEKEELVEIVIPVMESRIYNEIIMPFYDSSIYASLTGNGAYLQTSSSGNPPGISISPLDVDPVTNGPVFLNVYINGTLLEYGIDYSVPNLAGGALNSSNHALIAFDPAYAGASHSIDNTLQDGDKVTVDYLPDPTVINLVATSQLAVLEHCTLMSETKNRLERTCMFGSYEFVDLNFILDPVTGLEANFGAFSRSMFFYPGGPSISAIVSGASVDIDGQFIAPCAAGFVASNAIPTSLTNKSLQGFTINPRQKLSNDETNLIGGAGAAIVTPLAAGGKVLHGRTTSNSGSAVLEEYSVQRESDFVAKTIRRALQNGYVGTVITLATEGAVATTTAKLLDALVSQGIINGYKGVAARIDAQEPRQVDVQFSILPAFPLNWIFIKFSVES